MRRPLLLAALALAAVLGSMDLLAPDGRQVWTVREGRDGSVNIYDAESNRAGWGRRNRDGSVELFDKNGRRLGTVDRNGKTMRMERERGQR